MNWGGYDSWQNLKSWNVIQIAPSPDTMGLSRSESIPAKHGLALLAESHHPVVFPGANEREEKMSQIVVVITNANKSTQAKIM